VKAPEVEAQAKPRRMTQGEILAAFVDRMHRAGQTEHSSVTLKTNAKGEVQIDVTVRTGETPDVATVDDAAAKAKAVFDTLRAFYPAGALEPDGRANGD
jgi:hypothetical protein